MTDEQLAEVILERLREFSPAFSIRPLVGDEEHTVVVDLVLSRESTE